MPFFGLRRRADQVSWPCLSRRTLHEAADLVALRGTYVPTPYLLNEVGEGASGPARSELGQH